jgi:hypothetical protein
MSGMALTAILAVSVWLVILTIIVLLLVQQLGFINARLNQAAPQFDVFSDGLAIGENVPPDIIELLPNARMEDIYFLILSSVCSPCRKLVADFSI